MSSALVEARGLRKGYSSGVLRRGTVDVLTGVDLDVHPGELLALVGENGSGKSTLIRILAGMDVADAGALLVNASVGYCPQTPRLFSRLTVTEHLLLFGRVAGMSDDQIRERGELLLERFAFTEQRHVYAGRLSGGTRAKLNLTLALLSEPALLLLDEPYSGFDWDTYQRFWEYAQELADGGLGVVVVSHMVTEMHRFERVVELAHGRLVSVL